MRSLTLAGLNALDREHFVAAVGDEDEPCLETNGFLKRTIRSAGLWMCPNTGHAINLEEPAAFNAAVLDFFGAVERGRWPVRAA